MAQSSEWIVVGNAPIQTLAENLYRVEGAIPKMALKRVMTVAKLASGGLVVHSPIAADDAVMQVIDDAGAVEAVLVPNGYHRIDAARFAARYPKARFYCPAGARKKVEAVVTVHGSYADFAVDAAVTVETLDGTGEAEGAMLVRLSDGVTLVLNDSVFDMPHLHGFVGFVLKNITKSTGGPRVTRIAKLFVVKDKPAFRAHLERLADTPGLTRVIVSHERLVTDNPRAMLLQAALTV